MSSEINRILQVNVDDGVAFNDSYTSRTTALDAGSSGRGGQTQLISASAESDLDFGDKALVGGWLLLVNLDDTNYVLAGPKRADGSMQAANKILPKKEAWFYLPPNVEYRAIADTADVLLDVRLY